MAATFKSAKALSRLLGSLREARREMQKYMHHQICQSKVFATVQQALTEYVAACARSGTVYYRARGSHGCVALSQPHPGAAGHQPTQVACPDHNGAPSGGVPAGLQGPVRGTG